MRQSASRVKLSDARDKESNTLHESSIPYEKLEVAFVELIIVFHQLEVASEKLTISFLGGSITIL